MYSKTHFSDKHLTFYDDFSRNDFIFITESLFIFLNRSVENIFQGVFLLPKIFNELFIVLKFIILLPLRLILICISAVIYFTLAPIIYFYFKKRINDVRKINLRVQHKISLKKISKEELMTGHKNIKKALDTLIPKIDKLKGEPIMRPAIDDFNKELKNLEYTLRINAYPDFNEVVLSYDELRELQHADLSF